jgi:hypothetical protein
LTIIIIFGEKYMLWSSPSPHPSSVLSALFLSTISLRSFLNFRDQVSYPYKTRGKIIVLYIWIFTFLDSRREDESSKQHPSLSSYFLENKILIRSPLYESRINRIISL